MSVARLGNKPKVTRLKETITLLQAKEDKYAKKKKYYERELDIVQRRCREVDKKIHSSGVPQLPTTEERGQLQNLSNNMYVMIVFNSQEMESRTG